jgi:hypothetical protein
MEQKQLQEEQKQIEFDIWLSHINKIIKGAKCIDDDEMTEKYMLIKFKTDRSKVYKSLYEMIQQKVNAGVLCKTIKKKQNTWTIGDNKQHNETIREIYKSKYNNYFLITYETKWYTYNNGSSNIRPDRILEIVNGKM